MRSIEQARDTRRERAFAECYRQHCGAVLAFAVRRLPDREAAREVTVDVFRIAWTAFDPAAPPTRAWLLGVARHRVGDEYRRRDRDHRLHEALQREAVLAAGPASADGRVLDVLDRLPAPAREVLALTYWDGLSAAEAGRVLGCTPAAVWVRLHRARRAFARAWTEEE